MGVSCPFICTAKHAPSKEKLLARTHAAQFPLCAAAGQTQGRDEPSVKDRSWLGVGTEAARDRLDSRLLIGVGWPKHVCVRLRAQEGC